MKKKNKLLLVLLGAALASACQKESTGNRLYLSNEGYASAGKMAVDGNGFLWVEGDEIRLNGRSFYVDVDDGVPSISRNVELSTPYRAFYPASLNPSAALDNDDVCLTFPGVYTYSTDGTQDIEVPMAVKSDGGSRLFFRHLTGALNIQVKNEFGISLVLDSIVITSNRYQISGERNVTLSENIAMPTNCTGVAEAQKRVVMRFRNTNSYDRVLLSVGATKVVQIPVLPVGDDNRFTVSVAAHNVDDAEMKYLYTRTQMEGGALRRNQLGYVPVTFGGTFSVSGQRQVRFSPGNLRYTPNPNATHYTATGQMGGEWEFAHNQYDIIGSANTNYAPTGWTDLFGWGTSGWNSGAAAYDPTSTSMTDADYYVGGAYTNDLTGGYAYADWAYFNAIRNGGNAARVWRTMTIDEWEYLLTSRPDADQLYGLATIDGQHRGLVILPDGWSSSLGVTFSSGLNGFTTNAYSIEEWKQMEAFGAVFLPYAGLRLGTQYYSAGTSYWSATACHDDYMREKACRLNFSGNYIAPRGADERMVGYSVRPVRNK